MIRGVVITVAALAAGAPALAAGPWAATSAPARSAAAGAAGPGIELAWLNRTYAGVSGTLTTVREGPLEVRLSSPDAELTLHRNRLILVPDGAGPEADVHLLADLEGAGDLVADVDAGPYADRLTDRLVVPRQQVRVQGRARVERHPEGYLVRLRDLPPSAPLRIQSRLVGRIVGVCRSVGRLTGASCGALAAALSTVDVPLGASERRLFLRRDQLAPAERAYLERLLDPAPTAGG